MLSTGLGFLSDSGNESAVGEYTLTLQAWTHMDVYTHTSGMNTHGIHAHISYMNTYGSIHSCFRYGHTHGSIHSRFRHGHM